MVGESQLSPQSFSTKSKGGIPRQNLNVRKKQSCHHQHRHQHANKHGPLTQMTRDRQNRSRLWSNPALHKVLASTDAVANITTVLLVASSSARLQEHLPNNQHVTRVHFGPKTPLFSYWATASLYVITAAAALLLLARRRQLYFQHRSKIVLVIRLVRLVVQLATLSTPSAAFNIAAAVVGRVHTNPRKAPAMLVILPMAYYLQPAMLLLPWTLSAPLQLASTVAMLYYMWQFPCFLQHVQEITGAHASTPAWQVRAELSCSRVQSYAAMAASAIGVSASDFSAQACESTLSVQMLQIFGTLLCLLIGPVFAAREWEHWMAARCADHPPARSGSSTDSISGRTGRLGSGSSRGVASSSSRSGSSSSNGVSSNLRGYGPYLRSGLPAGADILVQLADAGAQEGSVWRGLLLRVLVLVLALPVVWLLSELLAEVFAATRDCPALLAAAGVRT